MKSKELRMNQDKGNDKTGVQQQEKQKRKLG